ncbi:unnamed protein product [Phytophthora fragariaefolia]|uniref:Unnamed protein product n=1 Tax=Phytophthora fragariaefolia TaxID=1490495 RepID=A0A9W7CR52_9STRA|nr:unnamed protein product [Phytophthora fragariaefolia]
MLWVLDHYDSVELLKLFEDEWDEVSIVDVVREIAAAVDFNGEIVFSRSLGKLNDCNPASLKNNNKNNVEIVFDTSEADVSSR